MTESKVIITRRDIVDPLLFAFILLAEKGIGSSITLQIGGTIVSGQLTSGKSFRDGLMNTIRKATVTRNNEEPSNDDPLEIVANLAGDVGEKLEDGPKGPYFFHMENVQIQSPGSLPALIMRTERWRGRIDAIDGFSFGIVNIT